MAEKPPTIFVIDDDASIRKGLVRLLTSAGLRVETFPSAEEYLQREPHEGLGCIVLDVRTGRLSGARSFRFGWLRAAATSPSSSSRGTAVFP
jgi:FixJ family two-component response regulator